ncbi:hypothetical protein JXA47_07380 [Candidatus Sumerlaeota bacterium]|nr:hypothetical protein [Candidatus Sumerlaeota bacterium]
MFQRLTLISLMLAAAICAGAGAPQMIFIGQFVPGALEQGDDHIRSGELCDVYWFDASAGQTISIRLDSDDFDPYLILRHPGGSQTENDDFDGTLNAGMNIQLPESGQYQLVVTSYQPGDTGAYTLRVMPLGEAPQETIPTRTSYPIAPPETAPEPQTEPITPPNPWATRQPTEPQSAPPITWQRETPSTPAPTTQPAETLGGLGSIPAPTTFPSTPPTSGGFGAPFPAPNVMPWEAPPTGTVSPSPVPPMVDGGGIAQGQTSRGQLGEGDSTLHTGEFMDEWTLQGTAGQSVAIRAVSEAFDTYLIVLYPGEGRAENDDCGDGTLNAEVDLTLPESGEYRIIVTSYAPEETGEYVLSVQ